MDDLTTLAALLVREAFGDLPHTVAKVRLLAATNRPITITALAPPAA